MCMVCGTFREKLFAKGLLIDMGVEGLYGRNDAFENVVDRVSDLIVRYGAAAQPEVLRFPPAIARRDFEKSGYLANFPDLAGTVHSFKGGDKDHLRLVERLHTGLDWTTDQAATDVTLAPAACYPLYPVIARRGPLPPQGGTYDIYSYCFRHEPSDEPTRMLSFRQREYVRIGTPEQVLAFRGDWLEKAQALADDLALPFELDVANDPFFGRAGRLMKATQREQALKFELLVPINDGQAPTACMSFNYHQDHFGTSWGLQLADGNVAHTACVGFGMERIALGLFKTHGLDVDTWPEAVRATLWA